MPTLSTLPLSTLRHRRPAAGRLGLCLALLAGLSACWPDKHSDTPATPAKPAAPPSQTGYLQRLDAYGQVLDQRVGGAGDVRNQVAATLLSAQPGTILVTGVGKDEVCPLPTDAFVDPDPTVGALPASGTDSTFSFGASLPTPIASLLDAHLKLDLKRASQLGFEDMTAKIAYFQRFIDTIQGTDCARKIARARGDGETVTIVRGSISARQVFVFNQGGAAGVGLGVKTIGNFDVSLAHGDTPVSMRESAPSQHFLILYNVPAPPAALAALAPSRPMVGAILRPPAALAPQPAAPARPPPAPPSPVPPKSASPPPAAPAPAPAPAKPVPPSPRVAALLRDSLVRPAPP